MSKVPSDAWKLPPLYEDDGSSRTAPADTWKIPPLIEDDGSSRTTSDGNPKVPPSNHNNFVDENSMKAIPTLIKDDGSSRTTSDDNPKVPPSNHNNFVDENSMKAIPTYTPYLKLPHLLSLAWVTYPVISLIIVAFRLQLSLASAENGLDSVKSDLLSSCTAAEKAATAAASLPRYMAEGSNRQIADAANGVINAAQSALILSLTVVEGLINFIIAIFRSTFLCLLELAMSIGLSLVTETVQALNTTVSTIGNDLANEIASANKVLTNAINTIHKIDPFIKITAPSISNSDLNTLRNLALPPSFQATLSSLNSSMPSANQVKDAIDDLVDTPFELLKKAINHTFDNLAFNASGFPVPAENRLKFCNNLDTSSIDKFKKDLMDIARYGTYIIIGLIFIITGLNCLMIWSRWRSMQGHFERTRQAWVSDPALNPNAFSASPPSAPQITSSNPNLMMPLPTSPSAPQGNLSDPNLMMSQAAFSSVPRGNVSDHNLTMSQVSAPQGNVNDNNLTISQVSAPQGNVNDQNLTMSQASAPQGNLSDHKVMMPQVSTAQRNLDDPILSMPQVSAPKGNLSDRNVLMMPQASAPQRNVDDRNLTISQASAPQGNLNDHNFTMPQASAAQSKTSNRKLIIAKASAPQRNVKGRNLTISQASAPQGNLNGHNLTMPQASAPQENVNDRDLTISQASAPQGNLNDLNLTMSQSSALQSNVSHRNSMSQASAPQSNLMMSQTPAPQGNFMMSQAPAPQGNFMMSQAVSPYVPQMTLSDHNLMMLQADSEHPLITRIMFFLQSRTGMTASQNIDMRWFFHYVFHPPALACFLIGFFGLLSVMMQLFLLGPLLAAARAGVDIAIKDISNVIVDAINKTMYEQSATYANGVNSKVDVVQHAINHGLFGWVNGTTSALNNTINHFYTEVQTFVTHLFNGTILEKPASNFLQCVIGNKVADIGEALTFLQDNLVIDIPRVSQDVLVLSSRTVNEASSPIASGAVGSGSNGDQGLLGDAIAVYQNSLKAEAWLFGAFMGLWGIVLASAIGVLLWRVHKRKKELAATKLQSVQTEVHAGLGQMKENRFSFPNDEKKDPFKLPSDQTEVQEESENMKDKKYSFPAFPNDEKQDPFKLPSDQTEEQVGLEDMKDNKFSFPAFPNDEKNDQFLLQSDQTEVPVELEHAKENKYSFPAFPNDEKKDPFKD